MYTNDTKFLISVVISADGFMADHQGKISFASKEDRLLLKKLMTGDQSDCFIVGRKTFQEMPCRISKPYIVLSHNYNNYQNRPNIIFSNLNKLPRLLTTYQLKNPVILGGLEIYSYFLQSNICLESHITVENNIILNKGLAFYQGSLGSLIDTKKISINTSLLIYKK